METCHPRPMLSTMRTSVSWPWSYSLVSEGAVEECSMVYYRVSGCFAVKSQNQEGLIGSFALTCHCSLTCDRAESSGNESCTAL